MNVNILNSLPLARSANSALIQFKGLIGQEEIDFSGAELLYERAFILGHTDQGRFSTGGSCYLMTCLDAMLAVNLPRRCDWELVPAWLGPWFDNIQVSENNWLQLEDYCRRVPANDLLLQAHILGLAVSVADQIPVAPQIPVSSHRFHPKPTKSTDSRQHKPLVVDLTSLWAGPLCANLLMHAGCRVIKVEDRNRNDGARYGNPDFYRLLNQGKEAVELDFRSAEHTEILKKLLSQADIVIEASRPRALRNLGIDAEQWLQQRPGLVWLSITGYGREGNNAERIGFGDDCAAAAGLSRIMFDATGQYHFAGDAIADPLTGLHAALYAWQSYLTGGNELLSISLQGTVSYCIHREMGSNPELFLQSCRNWTQLESGLAHLFPNGVRQPTTESAAPGQHNRSVMEEFGLITRPLNQQHHPEILDRFV